MLENFSRRAMRVVMEARLEAGRRGAPSIDVNSLVIGLITEDQDPASMGLNEQGPNVKRFLDSNPKPLAVLFPPSAGIKREAFFASEAAASLLAKLNEAIPRSSLIPNGFEMRTSPEFDRVLNVADRLREEFHRSKVQPPDILAAALNESCEATRLLKESGTTEEKVLEVLGNGAT